MSENLQQLHKMSNSTDDNQPEQENWRLEKENIDILETDIATVTN